MSKKRKTLSLSEELLDAIDEETGASDSISGWFEEAGWLRIEMQNDDEMVGEATSGR